MGNCCQQNHKDEFEVDVLDQNNIKKAGPVVQAQLNFSQRQNNAEQNDNSQKKSAQNNLGVDDKSGNDRVDSSNANDYTFEIDQVKQNQNITNTQGSSSLKQKFNLKIDLNKINNDITLTQNSEQDEPLLHRRQSSSENVHTQSQADSQQNYQQNGSANFYNNSNEVNSYQNNYNNQAQTQNQNKYTNEDADSFDPYQGQSAPKKQLNIKLDLEKINEQNENEEYNPNSQKRRQ